SPVPAGEESVPTIPHTVSVVETQISHQQPWEVTIQEKTPMHTGKLPLRVASKEDLLSTTYLLPGVREIFTLPPGNEQAAAPPDTGPVAFVEPQTTIPSGKFDHQVDATHKGILEKDAHALVLDRNAVTTPSYAPHRTNDGDSSLFERQSVTLIEDSNPL